jgi:DNA-binding CsgD family transcriptional regulator
MHVSLNTLDRAAQFIDSLAELDQPDRAAEFVLPRLAKLIGCDIATYQKMNPEPHLLGKYTEYPSGSLDPAAVEVYKAHLAEHPLVVHHRAGGRGPAKISDMVSRPEFRRLGIYAEYFRHVPIDDQIAFSMPGPRDGEVIGIGLSRADRDFAEEDRAVLSSVTAPLGNALRRSATRHRARAAVAGIPEGLADLTSRERQVLELAAAGRTNGAIARAINVSPRTIAKHLEHAYRKLGVTSRAAAVYRTAGAAESSQAALAAARTVDRHDGGAYTCMFRWTRSTGPRSSLTASPTWISRTGRTRWPGSLCPPWPSWWDPISSHITRSLTHRRTQPITRSIRLNP